MRPRSDLTLARFVAFALATVALDAACGTLASVGSDASIPAGDIDLPTSLLGPYRALSSSEAPFGSTALVQASGADVDEPSVVTIGNRRVAFFTYAPRGGPRSIGRAAALEQAGPRQLTNFEFATTLFGPELPWEMGSVGSPSVVVAAPNEVYMAYAGGNSIGLAQSSDGRAFGRRPEPVLSPDASQGESAPLEAPSLARAPTGEWFLAYASDGKIFLARAPEPLGPWTRIDADPSTPTRDPVLAPSRDVLPDAGNAFEMVSLGDPALSIHVLPSGRTLARLFYTATGPELTSNGRPRTVVGVAASYEPGCSNAGPSRPCFSRLPQPAYAERTNPVRAGSFEVLDDRAALLWIGTAAGGQRVISAAVAPATVMLAEPRAL